MFEFPNQNTVGLRRFVFHGIFWIALAVLNMFARQFSIAPERLAEAQSWFFLCWIIFTAIVLTAAYDLNVSLIVTFVWSLATFCWRSAISKRNLKGQWHSTSRWLGTVASQRLRPRGTSQQWT
jgi:succinate-acetate transporter protein